MQQSRCQPHAGPGHLTFQGGEKSQEARLTPWLIGRHRAEAGLMLLAPVFLVLMQRGLAVRCLSCGDPEQHCQSIAHGHMCTTLTMHPSLLTLYTARTAATPNYAARTAATVICLALSFLLIPYQYCQLSRPLATHHPTKRPCATHPNPRAHPSWAGSNHMTNLPPTSHPHPHQQSSTS